MTMDTDYQRIEHAIRYLSQHVEAQPALEDVSCEVGVSPFHLQRLFRRYAGITPKQFLQHLTLERAKDALDASHSVLDASLEAGLSSPARLHDHFITLEAITPGEYKSAGAGLQIRYGTGSTPFGAIFAAQTARGICSLSFVEPDCAAEALEALHNQWPQAALVQDGEVAANIAARIFESHREDAPIRLVAAGTNFQIRVWRALLEIPFGFTTTYRQIARVIGAPQSSRAVGNALASNPIAYLIPCHRIIQSTGAVGQYRWQPYRKRALLAWEYANAFAGETGG
jgi:AraC family transcriptional regulator, regulatory protein of adaptative response / methylated-DNA-[protein]-cysteine methyltransferase